MALACAQLSGEGGIRTRDTLSSIHTFQACSFNHSDTSPKKAHKEMDYNPVIQKIDHPTNPLGYEWKIIRNYRDWRTYFELYGA
jgi:hypothetical protein